MSRLATFATSAPKCGNKTPAQATRTFSATSTRSNPNIEATMTTSGAGSGTLVMFLDPQSQAIYDWTDWTVSCNLPFTFPENSSVRKYCALPGICTETSIQYLRVVTAEDLNAFRDPLFWDERKEAETVIAPLAYVSYRLQQDKNTVGGVVLSYRDIYRGFQKHLVRHDQLIECIEDRWVVHPGFCLALRVR
ncbi:hypothetical protein PHYPSEUDO_004539 [Phytophthora pseudosyringae]|uniref:Uncharacterized protein n=1 Tax=Phytophthora pseudosyringae TaxID=221518 RepID=A0A8T1WK32_9STRA|nr:hypothetical protein PHYPSEUDO_004539 [Phytophthora pseudosyringae]